MAKEPKTVQHSLPVKFQGFATKGDKATLGIRIASDKITPNQARRLFIKQRLTIALKLDPNAESDSQNQQTFEQMGEKPIELTADVKGYGEDGSGFKTTLHLAKSEVRGTGLDDFTDQVGVMIVMDVADIPSKADEDGEGDGAEGEEREAA